MSSIKADVAVVTETWFADNLSKDNVSIDDYDLFAKSRSHRRGGGVAIYA